MTTPVASTSTSTNRPLRTRTNKPDTFSEPNIPSSARQSSVARARPQQRRTLSPQDAFRSPAGGSYGTPSPSPHRSPNRMTGKKAVSGGDTNMGLGGAFGGDFWSSSFSSLSALASAALGSDTTAAGKGKENMGRPAPSRRKRSSREMSRALSPASRSRSGSQRQPKEWGPPGIDGGKSRSPFPSVDERYKTVQERKREALLMQATEGINDLKLDSKGNYKRRTSDELTRSPSIANPASREGSSSTDDSGQTSLVYIHHVQPTDSLMSVSIRYGCNLSVLQRANGFWPSDSIQTRQFVLLPTDACSVKGVRIWDEGQPDGSVDTQRPADTDASATSNPSHEEATHTHDSHNLEPAPSTAGSTKKGHPSTPDWKHEYWVRIEGFSSLVEVGRVPRHSLGFFPRARRKSKAALRETEQSHQPEYSHSSSAVTPSSETPTLRNQQSVSSLQSTDSQLKSPHTRRGHRRRKSSIVLSGPGGIGTLEPKGAAVPGPSDDGLNKFVKSHFPALNFVDRPPADSPADAVQGQSAVASPSGLALENVGSTIESWWKKMATKAKSGLDEFQASTQQQYARPGTSKGSAGADGRHAGSSPYARRGRVSSGAEADRAAARLGIPSALDSDSQARGQAGGDLIELHDTPPSSARRHEPRPRGPFLGAVRDESSIRSNSGSRVAGDQAAAPSRRRVPARKDVLD